MYFNDFDYEVFKNENIKENTQALQEKRKEIQEKLLDINEDIKFDLAKLYNLHPHEKKQHITSLLYPCEYNRGMVSWICIRYAKKHNFFGGKEETYSGFQKWNNFQISIFDNGIDMGFYHSVPHDSYDRSFVREKLNNNDEHFKTNLIEAVKKTQGYGYKFKTNAIDEKEDNFYFDNYSAEEVGEKFIDFYEKNCVEGKYSAILMYYGKNDERIFSKEKIKYEFLNHIQRLYPIFNALSWN